MAVCLLSLLKAAGNRLERHQSQYNVALLCTTREIEPPNRPVCFDAVATCDKLSRAVSMLGIQRASASVAHGSTSLALTAIRRGCLLQSTRAETLSKWITIDNCGANGLSTRESGCNGRDEQPLKQRRKADLGPRNDRHLGRVSPGLRPVPPQGKPFDPGSGRNPHGKKSGQLLPCRREHPQRSAKARGASARHPVPNTHGIVFTLNRATFGPLVQELETARRSGAGGLLASHANHVTSCFR